MKTITEKLKKNQGWILVILLSIIPFLLWLTTSKLDPPLENIKTLSASLGEILGLTGIVLLSLNFILASRLPFIEKLFYGLNNVYKQHNTIGQLAFIFLLFHPLLLIARYATNSTEAAKFLLPSQIWSRDYGNIALGVMIILIILTLYLQPKYNIWKITHKFFGLAILFGSLHAYSIPGYVMKNFFLKGYIIIITLLGITAFLYKVIFEKFLLKKYKYQVEEIKKLNDFIIEITLKPLDKKINFRPGQFVFISFNQRGLSKESHPFSITSAPWENNLKLATKKLGDYTSNLPYDLEKGALAQIEGPFGVFSYTNINNQNQIWIAGGIGITPFISMAKDLLNQNYPYHIQLFYCTKDEKEAIYLDFLKEIQAKFSNNFQVIPFLSNTNGHINFEKINNLVTNLRSKDILICAPPVMINALKNDFINHGLNKDKMHSEEFNF